MKKKVYKGNFSDWNSVKENFMIDRKEPKIVYAEYDYECYEGYATVVFKENDNWYYVRGSHCSCYGLENQFVPQLLEPEIHFKALTECKRLISVGGYTNSENSEQEFDEWFVWASAR
jgi:hypothetical protein